MQLPVLTAYCYLVLCKGHAIIWTPGDEEKKTWLLSHHAGFRTMQPHAAVIMIGNNNIYIGGYPKRPFVMYTPTRFGFVCTQNKCSQRGAFDYEECHLYVFYIYFFIIHSHAGYYSRFFFFCPCGRDNSWAGFRNALEMKKERQSERDRERERGKTLFSRL